MSKFHYCIRAPGTTITTTEHVRKILPREKMSGEGGGGAGYTI